MSYKKRTFSKRPLGKRELVFIVMDKDLTKSRQLRKNHTVHIGRTAREGGPAVAVACSEELSIGWQLPFHFFSAYKLRVCRACIHYLKDSQDELEGRPIDDVFFTPASNTGVN